MSRQIITFSTLLGLALISLSSDVHAGCGGRHHGYSHRYVRPVRVVRPVTVVHRVARPVVPQVVIAPKPAPNYPTVPAGSQLTLPGNFLGSQPGSVFMVFNNIKLPVQVDRWATTGVTITLPPMAIKDAVLIRLDIVLPSGKLGNTQRVRVTAPAPVVLHPVAPTPQLPTNPAISQTQAGPSFAPAVSMGSPLLETGQASQAIVLPQAGAAPANAFPTGVAAGTPSQPIVLPRATAPANTALQASAPPTGVAAGTPSQPIVLPRAVAPADIAAAAQAAQATGQPIVLPPAQASSNAAIPAAPVQLQAAPLSVDPMADNPILRELEQEVGLKSEPTDELTAPAADQVSSPGLLSVIFAALTK